MGFTLIPPEGQASCTSWCWLPLLAAQLISPPPHPAVPEAEDVLQCHLAALVDLARQGHAVARVAQGLRAGKRREGARGRVAMLCLLGTAAPPPASRRHESTAIAALLGLSCPGQLL